MPDLSAVSSAWLYLFSFSTLKSTSKLCFSCSLFHRSLHEDASQVYFPLQSHKSGVEVPSTFLSYQATSSLYLCSNLLHTALSHILLLCGQVLKISDSNAGSCSWEFCYRYSESKWEDPILHFLVLGFFLSCRGLPWLPQPSWMHLAADGVVRSHRACSWIYLEK